MFAFNLYEFNGSTVKLRISVSEVLLPGFLVAPVLLTFAGIVPVLCC